MAVKIRLLRMGKIRNPQYRIVVADSRTKRDGRAIEYVGIYHPKEDPSLIEVKSDRVQYWLSVGAQPSEAVQRLLEKTGDWQKFKGLPAPPPLLVADGEGRPPGGLRGRGQGRRGRRGHPGEAGQEGGEGGSGREGRQGGSGSAELRRRPRRSRLRPRRLRRSRPRPQG